MKTLKIIIVIAVFSIATLSNGQSPILPITTDPSDIIPDDAYIKDMDNELDKFTGTWQYINGNETFTVTLSKAIQAFNGDYYEDKLRGNYKYVNNGNVIMDYLSNDDSKISSNRILSYPNEIRFRIVDPERKRLSYKLVLTHDSVRNLNTGQPQEVLEWNLKITQVGYCGPYPNQPTPSPQDCLTDSRLPINMTLTKID